MGNQTLWLDGGKDLKNEAMGRTKQIEDIKRANGTVFIVETGRSADRLPCSGKTVVARLLSARARACHPRQRARRARVMIDETPVCYDR